MLIRNTSISPVANANLSSRCILFLSVLSAHATADQLADNTTPNKAPEQPVKLENIVVTATKQGETSLQKTPIAATVLNEADLELQHIEDMSDLSQVTPGLSISQNVNYAQIYMRGVGSNNVFPGSDPSVTIHYDGVYMGRPLYILTDFVEVDRIESLKGPQGTLYGRNSTGGTINIISKLPQPEFNAKFSAELGSHQKQRATAWLTGALGADSLMGSLAVLSNTSDGYVDNVSTTGKHPLSDDDTLGAEGKLRWLLNDDIEVIFSSDYVKVAETTEAYRYTGVLDDGTVMNHPVMDDFFSVNIPYNPFIDQISKGASLKLIADLGNDLQLTSITAYHALDSKLSQDSDYTEQDVVSLYFDERQNQRSQEFQLNGKTGNVDWLVGAFYFEEENDWDNQIDVNGWDDATQTAPPGAFIVLDADFYTTAYALYSQATYHVSPKLSLTAGIRYSYEEKEQDSEQMLTVKELDLTIPDFDITGQDDWESITPKLVANYQLTPDHMIYGSVSRGFKSGGYNGTNDDPTFDPEYLLAYEVGSKAEWLDQKLRVNTSLFHYDYSDLQVQTFQIAKEGEAPATTIKNAADATVNGLEVELSALITSDLRLDLGVSWLDATYDHFTTARTSNPALAIDAAGNDLNNSPSYTFNATVYYYQDIDAGTLTYRLNYYGQDDEFYTPVNDKATGQKAYQLVNASLSFTTWNEQWEVIAYGNNLTNEEYFNGTVDFSPMGVTGRINPPRTYGIRLIYQIL